MRITGKATAAVTALLSAAALVAVPSATAGARDAGYGPGAAGIGDPYYPEFGNGGYDVAHYDIRDAYNPDTGRLTGSTRLQATATKNLSRFNLDLVLHARSVRVDGEAARFRQREPQELVVTPPEGIDRGSTFEVVVRYRGKPEEIEGPGLVNTWVRTRDGAVAIGEPQIAAWWFASNDHPRDKATFDITVTAPNGTQAISNGTLVSSDRGAATTDWHWASEAPMATYLAFMAIGRYDIEQGTDSGGRPYLYAFSKLLKPAVAERARASVDRTAAITRFQETQFGPYPFDVVGGVVPGGQFFYALENQTRPVHSRVFFLDGQNPYVIAHEQAHQWYGDAIAVRSWRDIWLNEGFASYAEYLYVQHRFGVPPQRLFLDNYHAVPARDPFWKVRIGNPGPGHEFEQAVYDRGAMTLQALRNKIGKADFFDLLRRWAVKGENGSIEQFQRMTETYVRYPLDRFFRVWLYTREKPRPTVANGFVHSERLSASAQARVDRVAARMRDAHRLIAAAESGRLAARH